MSWRLLETARLLRKFTCGALCVAVACSGPFTDADDIVVNNPTQAVLDARELIAAKQRDPKKFVARPRELPSSLQIPKLRHANIHADHVDLVLARNPDWNIGARIWAKEHRAHRDSKTKYRDIFFYSYTNDAPETPDNIR